MNRLVFFVVFGIFSFVDGLGTSSESRAQSESQAAWIYSSPGAPENQFNYFRTVFSISTVPSTAICRFAADSNGHLYVNGLPLRRKVTRYNETLITAELVEVSGALVAGRNTLVVLHHSWGPITTFQRTAAAQAGVYVSCDFGLVSGTAGWRVVRAPEYVQHTEQIVGLTGDHRIRYPQIIVAANALPGNIHDPSYNDSAWAVPVVVSGPWPSVPYDVETEGQREFATPVPSVLAAGLAAQALPFSTDPYSIAAGIDTSTCTSDPVLTQQVADSLAWAAPFVLNNTGSSPAVLFVTFDFQRPVHGYPYLQLAAATSAGVAIDFGYSEKALSEYDGSYHVSTSGWLNTTGTVGHGYADRYETVAGPQALELPDERTMRWLTLHAWLAPGAAVVFDQVGIVQSQYAADALGSFDCGDAVLQQIVSLCLIHAKVSMSDSFVDCPGREDGQWIEDARLRGLLAARWFNVTALSHVLVRSLAQSQKADGTTHPFPPSNYPAGCASCPTRLRPVAAWPSILLPCFHPMLCAVVGPCAGVRWCVLSCWVGWCSDVRLVCAVDCCRLGLLSVDRLGRVRAAVLAQHRPLLGRRPLACSAERPVADAERRGRHPHRCPLLHSTVLQRPCHPLDHRAAAVQRRDGRRRQRHQARRRLGCHRRPHGGCVCQVPRRAGVRAAADPRRRRLRPGRAEHAPRLLAGGPDGGDLHRPARHRRRRR
eukprot:TRINITY_DN5738_c0_g2_i4.p1 TRINITY_DN5738_c0_g2~~TRINITY_DN5738_c0_g2_i4.p1  ORF type:complete len:710 (+),score=121.51 TRINITY_DN5738_c0_g2_i4:516-2645(+)